MRDSAALQSSGNAAKASLNDIVPPCSFTLEKQDDGNMERDQNLEATVNRLTSNLPTFNFINRVQKAA